MEWIVTIVSPMHVSEHFSAGCHRSHISPDNVITMEARTEHSENTAQPRAAWGCLISGITGDWVTEWYYRLPSITLPQSWQAQISPRCWELRVLLTSIRNVDVSEGCFLTFLTNQSHPIFKSDITLAWHDLNWLKINCQIFNFLDTL